MILEIAHLDVKAGETDAFELAFQQASPLIAETPGYLKHTLSHCIETPNRYVLIVEWESLEAHTVGFRHSDRYPEWKALLHHFYDPFPLVEHYAPLFRYDKVETSVERH